MNYVECIGLSYPGVQVSCFGDPLDYNAIQWEAGDPMPSQADLDAAMLANRREAVWLKLKDYRDWRESNNGTPITVNSVQKWFHSDDPSKIKQLALVKAADLGAIPANLEWKTMDSSFVIMTADIAYAVYSEAMTVSTTIFATAEQHRQNILASTNPEEYDYTTGWPQMFDEWLATQSTPAV